MLNDNVRAGIRGQGAMEYLMTYGWAILILLAIGLVLWQLGVFNLGGITTTTASGFPRIKPLLSLVSLNTSGYFSGYFMNGGGGTIRIESVSATSGGSSCTISYPDWSIIQTEEFLLNGTCSGTYIEKGDPYDIQLTITYNVSYADSTVTKVDAGNIRGPLE